MEEVEKTAGKAIEKVAAAPAIALDKTIDSSKQVLESLGGNHLRSANKFWQMLGPGLTTGAADDDPSGIATYSQQGAQTGFRLLWLAPFTFPLMAVVQEMCARIGLVTGRGLAANIRLLYPRWVLYVCAILLFVANTLNLGADLGAMAKATELLFPKTAGQADFGLLLIFALMSLALQIFTTYEKYAKYLKLLALILLSYVLSAMLINLNVKDLLFHSFVPQINFGRDEVILITGILGTTISPYLFFWQTSQEVEEEILKGKTTIAQRRVTTDEEIKDMRVDVWSGMFLSNLVMYFIIATCAATLFVHGITDITTAADATRALRPLAGDQAYLLFALGIIGTGMLAVPVLAGSASYALAESFRWKHGLYRKLKDANAFYGMIIISTFIGFLINFSGIDAIKALIYSAVLNGLIAPVILLLIVAISNNKKIMGDRVNHPLITFLGALVTELMILAGGATLYFLFFPH